jgi:AcrR family transcriptional regulator
MSAEQRRAQVVDVAIAEFARGGYSGTSTETIARGAGVSQPYLFRLFGDKSALYAECVKQAFAETEAALREAASGHAGAAAIAAMGRRYRQLLADTTSSRCRLHFQLEMYAGAVGDARHRQTAREQMAKLLRFIGSVEGVDDAMATDFVATGMLLNVLSALGFDYSDHSPDRHELPAALRAWAHGATRPAGGDRLPGGSGHSTSG